MDLFKSSLVEVTGGVFIGKVVDFFFSKFTSGTNNSLSAGGVPKIFVEIVAETALLAYLAQQFFNWEWRNGYGGGTQEIGKLFFIIGIFITTGNYIKRIRMLVGWIQSWTGQEFTWFNKLMANKDALSNPMLTMKENKGFADTAVPPTEQSMNNINFNVPIKLD